MKTQARLIRILLAVCIFLQASFFVLAWTSLLPVGSFMQMSASDISVEAMRALPLAQRLVGMLLALPAVASLAYGFWRLERMLANFERNALFDLSTIGHLRAFAGATLASILCSILEPALRSVVFKFGFAAPAMKFSIGVNSEQLLLVLVCGLFWLITGMMREGRRLAEENEGFV
jgi:hypothetical protein